MIRRAVLTAIACLTVPGRAVEAPAPFGAIPHERQITWQRMELYAFVHFGLNTWTNREWGYGDEDPKLFNPDAFDARAIVKSFREAGMTAVILTAKHHDGFCLWPTKTTGHNITKSPWKNGRGDLVREFADACRAEKLRFGIYVSPWDRNHAEYAREGYVKAFHEQIREVLTGYGPVFEIWFDGANGGDGWYGGAKEKRTIPPGYYRYPEAVEMIRKIQPQCVVWGAADARWGGSEQGHVAYPHWHTMDSQRGGDAATGVRHGDTWMPAEGDTSIRPGWFWHAAEDGKVKSPAKLMQVWMDCVGRGANLILNVPPDHHGRLREPDLRSLAGFKQLRDQLLATDFAAGAAVSAPSRGNNPRFKPPNLTDNDIETYWTTDDASHTPTGEIKLKASATFDVIRLREQIRLGQRVDAFAVDAMIDGSWKEIHAGKTIGHQVLAKLPSPVTTDRLRLRVTDCPAVPCLTEFSLLKMPDISTMNADPRLSPDNLTKTGWRIVSQTAGDASRAIDGDPDTLWHTHMATEQAPPQSFDIDLGSEVRVAAITYLPRQDGTAHGMTDRYRFELSQDGKRWITAAEGEFSNIRANPVEQTIPLKSPINARFLRFTGLRCIERNHISAAEIGVIPAK
jgi:alpha-L-fucosidase